MSQFALALLLFLYPIQPELSIKFKDISVKASLAAIQEVYPKLDVIPKVEGRVGNLTILKRGNLVVARVKHIMLHNDAAKPQPLESFTVHYNIHTGRYWIHAIALGGIFDLDGELPK